jgi:hypothetical protein
VTTPDDYGISPEVLAAAADRQNRLITAAADRDNRLIADTMAAADRQNRLIANIGPVMSIIERQHNAMEAMRSSFEFGVLVRNVSPGPNEHDRAGQTGKSPMTSS